MTKTIDTRGLACPQPVIQIRNALQGSDTVLAIVDNEMNQQNVSRMAAKIGFQVQAEKKTDGIYLTFTKGEMPQERTTVQSAGATSTGPFVLTISCETMGRGDEVLGQILIRSFFHTLGEVAPLPDTIIFFNSGVKLVVNGSPLLEDLKNLSDQGIDILACGTCLGHYELKDKVAVGKISNMYSIAELLLQAGKIVNL